MNQGSSRFLLLFILLVPLAISAQQLEGTYRFEDQQAVIQLTIKQARGDIYLGRMEGNGNSFELVGNYQGKAWVGYVENSVVVFQAELRGSTLHLVLAEMSSDGQILPQTAQKILLQKVSAEATREERKVQLVIINQRPLSEDELKALEAQYGIRPRPGNYWYDARSGLYGVVGYPAYGFMLPGHEFGPLDPNASKGNTGIFVNGRELPRNEYIMWSYIVGNWIRPGRYWLDASGNAGLEGNPAPLINLYAAAQQNNYRGKGSAGGNFWTSRFSAGNYDSGNQRGYVSVPGYGPVGYGF